MKLVIYGPEHQGESCYYLLTEEGEVLFSHYCSHICYAKGDLIERRPERQGNLNKRWPEGWQVVTLAELGITSEEMLDRNMAYRQRMQSNESSVHNT